MRTKSRGLIAVHVLSALIFTAGAWVYPPSSPPAYALQVPGFICNYVTTSPYRAKDAFGSWNVRFIVTMDCNVVVSYFDSHTLQKKIASGSFSGLQSWPKSGYAASYSSTRSRSSCASATYRAEIFESVVWPMPVNGISSSSATLHSTQSFITC